MRSSSSSLHIICSHTLYPHYPLYFVLPWRYIQPIYWGILLSNTPFMSSQRTLETYHKMATPTPTMSNAIYRHLVTECFCVSKIFGFWFSFPPRVPMTILKTYFNSSLRRRLYAIDYSISTKCGFSKSSYTFTRIWHRVYNFCSILPIYRIEIITEFLCLRTLCFLYYLNFWQFTKKWKILKSDKIS